MKTITQIMEQTTKNIKELMEKRLLDILTDQNFYEFYNGPLDNHIKGNFELGTQEDKENDRKVKEYVRRRIAELLK